MNTVKELSKWLRNYINTPTLLNVPIDNGSIQNIKSTLSRLSAELKVTNQFVSQNLQNACRVLFYRNNLYSNPPQLFLNPYAAGRITCLLDMIIDIDQNPQNNLWGHIHPSISKASKSLFLSNHYANAAEDAFIEINSQVKKLFHKLRPNDPVPDGAAVMNTVFSNKNPMIKFCDLSDDTGKNTQLGYMEMLAGAMSALRNPKAHSNDVVISKEEAMRRLMFASMLMYKIDEGVKYSNITE